MPDARLQRTRDAYREPVVADDDLAMSREEYAKRYIRPLFEAPLLGPRVLWIDDGAGNTTALGRIDTPHKSAHLKDASE